MIPEISLAWVTDMLAHTHTCTHAHSNTYTCMYTHIHTPAITTEQPVSLELYLGVEGGRFGLCSPRALCPSQDNYTFAQPGIQKKVKALEELVSRIDGRLR